MSKTVKGSSAAGGPILGAPYWKQGTALRGKFRRRFNTINGECIELILLEPKSVKVEDKDVSSVSIGALKGFVAAMNDAESQLGRELRFGDTVTVLCTGERDTGKGNPMVDFEVAVETAA